ncbi:DUF4123 domain-containing protein [Roseateles koreensis]|uniref:DUF4123 domain-containing protein n=1 Tax=Roseateles koreensis TaxID=2987526 RepID=A0ABT5KT28_9BURK|nr:DUF4123 domain-containing protein [Roseateles koreensis]MDC8786093.1 DUF4123 domain-containing protein [Roseateles koreensis]
MGLESLLAPAGQGQARCIWDENTTAAQLSALPWLVELKTEQQIEQSWQLANDAPAITWVCSSLGFDALHRALSARMEMKMDDGSAWLIRLADPRIVDELNAWRLQRIDERGKAARSDRSRIASEEQKYAKEQSALTSQIKTAEQDPARLAAQKHLQAAEQEAVTQRSQLAMLSRSDWLDAERLGAALKNSRAADTALAQAKTDFAKADDPRLKLEARKANLPGQGLADKLDAYDAELLLDIEALRAYQKQNPKESLRPHYANLMAVYSAQFDKRLGILAREPEVLAIFDNYVHDSLAALGKDETLPSDPRVIYVGGDAEIDYAMTEPKPSPTQAQMA